MQKDPHSVASTDLRDPYEEHLEMAEEIVARYELNPHLTKDVAGEYRFSVKDGSLDIARLRNNYSRKWPVSSVQLTIDAPDFLSLVTDAMMRSFLHIDTVRYLLDGLKKHCDKVETVFDATPWDWGTSNG
jgi:hypothetical protein